MKIQVSLFLFTITVLHTSALSQQKDQNLIVTTCKNTPNYQLCIATLRASPASTTADVEGLGLIMVAAVKTKTEEAMSTVNKLIHSGHPKLIPALQRCTDVYNAVLKADVPVAVEALKKGDPKFAENGMADTVVEANVCDRAFHGVVNPSPMSGPNKAISDLAAVARAIIRNLL